MGKIRVKSFGDQEEEKKAEKLAAKRAEKKAEKKAAKDALENPVEEVAPEPQEQVQSSEAQEETKKKESKYKAKQAEKKIRSKKYLEKIGSINPKENYSLAEGIKLLDTVHMAKFDETVELHINTNSAGISGQVTLPHGSGKKVRVAIASDDVLAKVEKGTVDFDILLADPSMMPKLAKVAKVLGPRGLMPNPKNGTITADPQAAAKKFEGGAMNFKTEKAPIIHMTVGKLSFGPEKLEENIKAALTAVKKTNIRDVTLKSTMSPGIRLNV